MNKNDDTRLWEAFFTTHTLTDKQKEQFKHYFKLIIEYNKQFNLTAITSLKEAIPYHFEDSIKIGDFIDIASCSMISDIGTGAGLPGIPLKICYPQVPVVLVEVTQKKVDFLNHVIAQLGLENIEVCSLDWRTFLRQTNYPIDLVCARASLRPDELVRMFKGSSPYNKAQLVYWASDEWEVGGLEQSFYVKKESYKVGDKERKYVFFNKSKS